MIISDLYRVKNADGTYTITSVKTKGTTAYDKMLKLLADTGKVLYNATTGVTTDCTYILAVDMGQWAEIPAPPEPTKTVCHACGHEFIPA